MADCLKALGRALSFVNSKVQLKTFMIITTDGGGTQMAQFYINSFE